MGLDHEKRRAAGIFQYTNWAYNLDVDTGSRLYWYLAEIAPLSDYCGKFYNESYQHKTCYPVMSWDWDERGTPYGGLFSHECSHDDISATKIGYYSNDYQIGARLLFATMTTLRIISIFRRPKGLPTATLFAMAVTGLEIMVRVQQCPQYLVLGYS